MVGKQTVTQMKIPGYRNVHCLTKSTPYGSLSPYELRTPEGHILENRYQFSKCYEKVPASKQRYSRFDQRVIWEWPAETHKVTDANGNQHITPQYLNWRKAGMNCTEAVRYPVGRNNMAKCLFALAENNDGTVNAKTLTYVESRKAIYIPIYEQSVQGKPQFVELKNRLAKGENLLIIEIDGPHEESLLYYREKYGVGPDFIQGQSMLCTPANLNIMLNDPLHPYGHGYCLAAALQDIKLV
jgi:hypothetical protein